MRFKRPSIYLLPAAIYFIYFASLAFLVPFLALYYQHLGLTGGQIGLLMSVSPLISLFANPLWGGLADATQRHKTILTITLVASATIMAFVPALRSLWLLLPVVILFAFFSAPIMSLVDSATLSMMGAQRERYGRLRIWGTIGWGAVAPFAGSLLQRHGLEWAFWIYTIGMLLVLLPARRLPFDHTRSGASFRQGLRTLLRNRRWLFFLALTFTAGLGLSVSNSYLSVLMESLGGSRTMTGIALTVATLSELPVMFFSHKLLRRLGARGLFTLAIVVAGGRCLLYAWIGSPAGIIAVQVLHGLTFAALWVSGVTYAAENAPPGLNATAQGLFGSMLMGFGAAGGNLLGGLLIERLNPSGMYGVMGAVVLGGLIIFLLLEKWLLSVRLHNKPPAASSPMH